MSQHADSSGAPAPVQHHDNSLARNTLTSKPAKAAQSDHDARSADVIDHAARIIGKCILCILAPSVHGARLGLHLPLNGCVSRVRCDEPSELTDLCDSPGWLAGRPAGWETLAYVVALSCMLHGRPALQCEVPGRGCARGKHCSSDLGSTWSSAAHAPEGSSHPCSVYLLCLTTLGPAIYAFVNRQLISLLSGHSKAAVLGHRLVRRISPVQARLGCPDIQRRA